MKRSIKITLLILGVIAELFIVLFVVLAFLTDEEDTVVTGEMDKYYVEDVNDTGAESATVMFYMIGSDLESEGGCASSDIEEILAAELGEHVNVVLQTGGAFAWTNARIDAGSCQRFSVQDGELVLEKDLGLLNTTDPDTLADFVRWTAGAYPADRYGLILWNHGGGTMLGFGADEYYPGDSLYLQDIQQALGESGVSMDFIGFDACLMGTLEAAYMLEPYADYMIASEEMEPGSGWYYTDWLTTLGKNPGIHTEALGRQIVDDFVNGPDSSFWNDMTLAVIRLKKIPEFYEVLCGYLEQSEKVLEHNGYETIATARSDTRAYGEGEYEQVDIEDYIKQADVPGGDAVIESLEEVIAYSDANISGANGLAMYFPYVYPEYYEDTMEMVEEIGIENDNYQAFFNQFINILVYGQTAVDGNESLVEALTGYESGQEEVSYEDASWYDAGIGDEYEGMLETLDTGELYLTEKGDGYVLSLSDEEWDTISYIELQVYLDDGEGYFELGCDNTYEYDEDGDLITDFDYTWVALNGQVVPFYAEEEGKRLDGSYYTYGYVPAQLNEEKDIEIMLYWDDEHEEGYVAGYRPYSGETLAHPTRNLYQLEQGDKLDFYCDYYTYDGEYEASYYIGEPLICDGQELSVSYEEVEGYDTLICYYLLDLYRNEYWTESLEITQEE